LATVPSEDNRLLLRVIRDAKPRSLTELTGRKAPNLSRTLRTMVNYGLVALDKREVRPTALTTQLKVLLD